MKDEIFIYWWLWVIIYIAAIIIAVIVFRITWYLLDEIAEAWHWREFYKLFNHEDSPGFLDKLKNFFRKGGAR